MNLSEIKDSLWEWLSGNIGVRHVFTLTFDSSLVSGNEISGSINSESFDNVSFADSHSDTMTLFAESLQNTSELLKAEVTGEFEITCTSLAYGSDNGPISISISGGASQPVVTSTTTVSPVPVTCYFANQKMPIKTPYPFATIRIGSVVPVSTQHLKEINENTNLALLTDHMQATITVNYFGENAIGELAKAYNSLSLISVVDQLNGDGVAIGQKFQIQDLSQFLDTEVEERASFDFYIRFKTQVEADFGLIETVEITGNIDTDGDDITVGPYIIGE